MSTARMPGRNPAPRVDKRNCYMTDEEVARREEVVAFCDEIEEQHNFPATVWYVLVAIAGVGSFFAGLLMGQ